jgi:D-tyrosyl-tRNA(Tyr) deacylase
VLRFTEVRALVQRVKRAQVTVISPPLADGTTPAPGVVGAIGPGLLALVGVHQEDDEARAVELARKVVGLRIFEDPQGRMNLSLQEVGGQLLAVSQFTLYADTRKGRRPSFVEAAAPEKAEPLVARFVAAARELGAHVETGRFRAHMEVELCNDGPVTLMIEV